MLLGYGVDLVVNKLSEGLTEAGHEVTVVCNVSDETFQKAPYVIRQIRYGRRLTLAGTERHALEVTEPALKDQDVLIPCTFPYYYVALRSGRPWVPIDFGVVPPEFYRGRVARELRYHWRTLYGEYFQHASTIVCISEFLRRRLPAQYANKTEVLYPGIDHYRDTFLCDLRRLYQLDGRVLLYFGRSMDYSPYKNVDALLRIFRSLRKDYHDLHLLISTNCSSEEQRRLERNGAIVTNSVLMHFVPSLYTSANIYLTATLWEGFDLPLLEASYFGLPVVANAIGAHSEIVGNGVTGFLADSEAGLAEHVRQLLEAPQFAIAMGEKGKAYARRNFRWADTVARFEKILAGIRVK